MAFFVYSSLVSKPNPYSSFILPSCHSLSYFFLFDSCLFSWATFFCYFFFIWLYIARILFRLSSSRAPRLQGRVGRCGSGSALSVLFGWLWLALLIYLWDVIIPDLSPPFFTFALFRSLFSYLGRWESEGGSTGGAYYLVLYLAT